MSGARGGGNIKRSESAREPSGGIQKGSSARPRVRLKYRTPTTTTATTASEDFPVSTTSEEEEEEVRSHLSW